MRITRYVTAFATDLLKLDREVNELITQGYQPYGDPYVLERETVSASLDRFLACQAMISHDEQTA